MPSFPVPQPRYPGPAYPRQGPRTAIGQAAGALQEGIEAGNSIAGVIQHYRDAPKRREAHGLKVRIMQGKATEQDLQRLPEVMPLAEAATFMQVFEEMRENKGKRAQAESIARRIKAQDSMVRYTLEIAQAPRGQQQQMLAQLAPRIKEDLLDSPEGQKVYGVLMHVMRDGHINDEEYAQIMLAMTTANAEMSDFYDLYLEDSRKKADRVSKEREGQRDRESRERIAAAGNASRERIAAARNAGPGDDGWEDEEGGEGGQQSESVRELLRKIGINDPDGVIRNARGG